MRKAAILAMFLPAALQAQQVKPRIIFNVDTSGSMAWDVCDPVAVGDVDSTVDCPGADVPCQDCPGAAGCGNGLLDDGRLWKVKKAMADVVTAFGEVEFGLARFHSRPVPFACIGGGWEGPDAVNCLLNELGSGDNSADILVKFDDPQRTKNLLEWIDLQTNFVGTPPPAGCSLCDDCGGGCDKELRPTGATPVAGSIVSCKQYIDTVRLDDPQKDCRPYAMIVLSDGENNCPDPNNPADPDPTRKEAQDSCADGVPVHVIGFASPTIVDRLNAIAQRGCGPACNDVDGDGVPNCSTTAILVDNETDLALAFADIVQSSIRVELCNGQDDDCDGLTDEDFVTLGTPCGRGRCAGSVCCDTLDPGQTKTVCCGLAPTCEDCNRIDDDCDGQTDELGDIDKDCDGVPDPDQVCECYPEECNGVDDDCDCPGDTNGDGITCGPGDALVDEEPLITSGYPCGTDIGECKSGRTCCSEDGKPSCCGEVGPVAELCDCKDNDCNGFTDESSNVPCFTLGDGCDPATGLCKGICVMGRQECRDTDPSPSRCVPGAGPCLGERGPDEETCNCIDDDCDGQTDEDVICEGGGACENCTCPLNCDPTAEFPCTAGFNCECIADAGDPPVGQDPCECDQNALSIEDCMDNFFCQVDVCIGVECEECEFCDARAGGVCKSLCAEFIQCQDWEECRCDICVDISCTNPQELRCGANETCDPVLHECVPDPCLEKECPEDEYCRSDGVCTDGPDDFCVPACPDCVEDQTCECGVCVDDPCANTQCLENQVCCGGECVADPCVTQTCDPGYRCDQCTGACLADNCALGRINCPDGYVCRNDQCVSRRVADPDRRTVSVSGAGGCSCRVASAPPSSTPAGVLLLLGLAIAFVRRRS